MLFAHICPVVMLLIFALSNQVMLLLSSFPSTLNYYDAIGLFVNRELKVLCSLLLDQSIELVLRFVNNQNKYASIKPSVLVLIFIPRLSNVFAYLSNRDVFFDAIVSRNDQTFPSIGHPTRRILSGFNLTEVNSVSFSKVFT